MSVKLWRLCVPILFFCAISAGGAFSATLAEIKARGTIRIAVKSDYKPWGFVNEAGALDGMEPELARDIARRLKVKLELVPAVSSNRLQLMNEGKADIILATFSITPERRKQVYFVEPAYYAAMTAILHKSTSGMNEGSLKERKLCSVAGNYSNAAVTGLVGGNLMESKTLTEAEERLREGECDGVNFDDVVLLYQLKSEAAKWQDYDISLLLGIAPAPWGIAIPLGEKDGALSKFLSLTVQDWHRNGTLLKLEKKWVGDNSMALQWLSSKVKAAAAKQAAVPPKPSAAR